jgi:hypothetical protein
MTEFPWPEEPERVRRRVRGIVDSLVHADELDEVRLEWVTPAALPRDVARWVVLRLTVLVLGDEACRFEIWGPDWYTSWDQSLELLTDDLEDWVCETSFAWGQQRNATPDMTAPAVEPVTRSPKRGRSPVPLTRRSDRQ